MDFIIPISIPPLAPPISYQDDLLLVGSCFTEHIGKYLEEDKFNILQNPNGIIFDPHTISQSVISWIENEKIKEEELFQQNEIWLSWKFHSRFSSLDKAEALQNMNASIEQAHHFLKKAKWLIITLGTSFQYKKTAENFIVANCHKVPGNQFQKQLSTIDASILAFDIMLYRLFQFNPDIRVMFTVSPVRHIKDGIVENNRSKARLLEVAHHLVDKFDRLYYFPAYEIMMDVLRDYRFYDADLVHPNYAGTKYVLEQFSKHCMDETTQVQMEIMHKITIARNHKPFNPNSQQHYNFLKKFHDQCVQLQQEFPHLNFSDEINYFSNYRNVTVRS